MESQALVERKDTEYSRLPPPPETSDETTIAKGTAILGNLHGSGVLWVEGAIHGTTELSGVVIIAAGGMVKGSICADEVYVAGCVEGDIFAKNLLRLEMTGDIRGDVSTASFLIQDGGCLNGVCTMTKAGQEPTFLY